jgi:adenylate cyclase
VLYGNIGTPTRLEFSVIGAAANETARIESLCKETGRDVVASGGVTEALGEHWESLGNFELRGVGRAIEVYAMPDEAPA